MSTKNPKPKYTGIWDNGGIAMRYFIFDDKMSNNKVMIDKLGVSGVSNFYLNPSQASFSSRYIYFTDEGKIRKDLHNVRIIFSAKKDEKGFYYGDYHVNYTDMKGEFTLDKFKSSSNLELILSNIIEPNRAALIEFGLFKN